ncbi:multiple epidermal growth factor-like domains protein 11 [Gigantopelta aegis]|uniref:multiple epidermal growth factor-like domains protein 11 n=1 Tax=Gigantopelta aegis TaxID=1735272 RepID=UPI001B88DD7C|nr:multiple epidermal growth factor-like domains protein 11 [Gigantopelta aegis]
MAALQIVGLIVFFLVEYWVGTALGSQEIYRCHCAEGCPLSIEQYLCTACLKGFYGRFCQTENVALAKTTNQSATCFGHKAEALLAVDGDIRTDFGEPGNYHCTCSEGVPRFWSVDLGRAYPLNKIKIYQRQRIQWRLTGFHIEVDGHGCYRWSNASSPPTIFEVNCNQEGQHIVFKVPPSRDNGTRQNLLTLCEIQVFVCTDFWYGEDCDKTCNCRNETEVCDKKTGRCTACPDGWTGDSCDACSDGYWGIPCKVCGNCQTGYICNTTTGHCRQCLTGWELPSCTSCGEGHYGGICNDTCGNCIGGNTTCDIQNGVCTSGCAAGWEGVTCKIGLLLNSNATSI